VGWVLGGFWGVVGVGGGGGLNPRNPPHGTPLVGTTFKWGCCQCLGGVCYLHVHGQCDRVNITTGVPCWTKLSMCKAGCKCCSDSRLFGGSFLHGPCKSFGQKWQQMMKF